MKVKVKVKAKPTPKVEKKGVGSADPKILGDADVKFSSIDALSPAERKQLGFVEVEEFQKPRILQQYEQGELDMTDARVRLKVIRRGAKRKPSWCESRTRNAAIKRLRQRWLAQRQRGEIMRSSRRS